MLDIKNTYEEKHIKKVVLSRGTKQDYLRMDLDYSKPGVLGISMKKYIEGMITKFLYKEELNARKALSPAADYLFMIDKDAKQLDQKKKECFYTWVAKGLFLCKRARPDLQTAVAFLTTRVRSPDEDDWKKLKRMVQYLRATKGLFLCGDFTNRNALVELATAG